MDITFHIYVKMITISTYYMKIYYVPNLYSGISCKYLDARLNNFFKNRFIYYFLDLIHVLMDFSVSIHTDRQFFLMYSISISSSDHIHVYDLQLTECYLQQLV